MPRIVGVDIPREKRIDVSLRYVYGIGQVLSAQILKKADIDPSIRAKNLTDAQVMKIVSIITDGIRVEGDLRREVSQNIRRLTDIGSHRGYRHRRGLPVRGQRTHTNARTRKGPRQMVGGAKKPTAGPPRRAPGKAAPGKAAPAKAAPKK